MEDAEGKRRDLSALERRRSRAVKLLRKGVWQSEVARRVGVHRQSVSRWAEKLKRGGERALKKAGRLGRRNRLRPEDLRRVERRLKRGPITLGYDSGRWTAARVAELIQRECGVKYDPSQAWRILRQMGWRFHPSMPKAGLLGTPGWQGGEAEGWKPRGRG